MSRELSSEDRLRLDELFDRAAPRPAAEHAAFVERECGSNEALRDELARLLAGLAGEDVLGRIQATTPTRVGTVIGSYELLEKVGEGGMGEVYAAQQLEPVRRRVALKLIRAGMDSRQVIERFEAERQALAMMDHPNMAKVLDAGSTESGQPYFVMEFIEGESIIEYCDAHRLDTNARLGLFVSVCHAIQHAHQKGIIHRDIKPSNVQVVLHDGQPAPKVIDFGIAKAIHSDATSGAQLTQHLQMVGTPAYMSPEQAGMTEQDIDTRSDIYALGVLLYELLTGTTPFHSQQLSDVNLAEMVRLICEETPDKPSTRISATSLATQRPIDRRRLALTLRGDLDWIVMKCLEKDRARRYETASGLAEDVERHLRDEPVTAGPPSTTYRLRKFVRRNRVGVLAAASIAAVMVLGSAGTTWGLLWALDEKERANQEAAKAVLATGEEAKARAAEALRAAQLKQVVDFQTAQLGRVDSMTMGARMRRKLLADATDEKRAVLEPALSGSNFTSLALDALEHDVFRPTLTAIDAQFEEQPEVQAQLADALAEVLNDVGLVELALESQVQALEIWTRESGADDPHALNSLNGRGALLLSQGEFSEAEACIVPALAGLRRQLGDDHPSTLNSIDCLADLLRAQGQLEEAETSYREGLARRRQKLGDDHPDTLESIRELGAVLREQGRLSEAEGYLQEALDAHVRLLGDDHRQTLNTQNSLAVLRQSQDRLAEAEVLHRELLDDFRRVLGDDHPATLTAIANLSGVLQSQHKYAEAAAYSREGLERDLAVRGDRHPHTLLSKSDLGVLLVNLGRYPEAEPYLREALAGQRELFGDLHASTLTSINNLATLLRYQGRLSEAEPYFKEALEGQRSLHPGDHLYTFHAMSAMGGLLKQQGRLADAEPYYREALDGYRRLLGEDGKATLTALDNLGVLLMAREEYAEAEVLFRKALEGARRVLGNENLDTLITALNLGGLLVLTGRFAEAEPLYAEVLQGFSSQLPANHPRRLSMLNNMGELLRRQGRFAEAETYLVKSLQGLEQALPPGHPYTLGTLTNVGFAVHSQGRADEAARFFLEALAGYAAGGDEASIQRVLRDWVEQGDATQRDSWTTFHAKSLLGAALLRSASFAEAEPLLLAGQAGLRQRESAIPAKENSVVADAGRRLVALYTEWERAEPGAGHAAQAAEWQALLDGAPEEQRGELDGGGDER